MCVPVARTPTDRRSEPCNLFDLRKLFIGRHTSHDQKCRLVVVETACDCCRFRLLGQALGHLDGPLCFGALDAEFAGASADAARLPVSLTVSEPAFNRCNLHRLNRRVGGQLREHPEYGDIGLEYTILMRVTNYTLDRFHSIAIRFGIRLRSYSRTRATALAANDRTRDRTGTPFLHQATGRSCLPPLATGRSGTPRTRDGGSRMRSPTGRQRRSANGW